MIFNNNNPYVQKTKCPENDYCILFYNILFDKAMSLFEWKGKEFEGPDATLNRDYLEWSLLTQGQATFIYDNEKKLRGLQCTRVGLDPYNFPVEIMSANAVLGTLTGTVNKDAVWIRNNKFAVPSITRIAHYAKQLAKIQLSLDISLNNNRMTKVFLATNDAQANQIRKLIDDVSAGKEAVLVKKSIMDDLFGDGNDKIPVYGTPSEYLAANYIQDMRSIMNNFLVEFGVDCNGANIIKKERNVTDEVNSNNQEIMINRDHYLSTRKQACEIANKIFGTNLSVDIKAPDLEENGMEDEDDEIQEPESRNEQD